MDEWVYPTSATLQIEINEIINNLNKRVKYEEPCDERLSSTVPREGRVKVPPLTRQKCGIRMSIINRFLSAVTEPEFKLARDLTAMAIADGEVTPEEKAAISAICHLEGINESKLLESLRGGYEHVNEEMPNSRKERQEYLRNLIKLIGADGYAAPQEVYLFQIVASKMGLNQMDVVSMFLLTTTREYFAGDIGSRILVSFLKNYIAPKAKSEMANRESLSAIYETVASHTVVSQNEDFDREMLRRNLAHTTATFLENTILIKEFADVGLDFALMAKQEEMKIFKRYTTG